jgi:hypothetical protein
MFKTIARAAGSVASSGLESLAARISPQTDASAGQPQSRGPTSSHSSDMPGASKRHAGVRLAKFAKKLRLAQQVVATCRPPGCGRLQGVSMWRSKQSKELQWSIVKL